jgi:serine protease AprX
MFKSNSSRSVLILSFFLLTAFSAVVGGENLASTALFTPKSQPVVTKSLDRILAKVSPETSVPVWVFFTDKGISSEREYRQALTSAASSLSERALKRRAKMHRGSVVDFRDVPVKNDYVQLVLSKSVRKRQVLKWFNAVTVEATRSQIEEIAQSPFVREVREIKGFYGEYPKPSGGGGEPPEIDYSRDYGPSLEQLLQINVPPAHELGFDGKGIIVCMHDTGFRKGHEAFAQAFADERVLAEWDFVKGDGETDWEEGDEPDQPDHGTFTWSTLGGQFDGELYGPSYNSYFILAKTEDVGSEHHIEEDNWAAGAEWADSIGAQVISSSLGYRYDFDPPDSDYTYEDMDGNTTIVTIAADLAVYNGIAICNAMGNEGPGAGTMIAPADGDSVISCGAVYLSGYVTNFSSRGPTYDGRTKPEVCALGSGTYCADPWNMHGYVRVSGTSLSTPLVGGSAGAILSAHPDWTPVMVREALMMTADNADDPDNDYGWGIVNLTEAIFYHPEGDIVIGHFPVCFATESMSSYRVSAEITCDHGLNVGELKIFWNTTGVEPFDVISMTPAGGDSFYADIPGQGSGTTVYYYIYAEDSYSLSAVQPLGAPEHLFNFTVGDPRFYDGFEVGPYAWETGGQGKRWGLSADYSYNGVLSFTDSPVGSYESNSNTWVAMRDGVDLGNSSSALLSFYHRYNIWEDDFGYIEVSTDGGSSWEQLGEAISGTQDSFVEETRSLDDYLGEEDVRIRFRLTSDIFDNQDGWYIDDLNIIVSPTVVSLSCEALTPVFCRGKKLYFKLSVSNSTSGNVSGRLSFVGYAGYGCDPANILVTIPRNKSYPPGLTVEYYYFQVPNAVTPGQYSASIGGSLGSSIVYCCMNVDIVQCQPWKIGDNTTWELVEVERPEVSLPAITELHQNYPNPFNSSTEIVFSIPEECRVSLTIHNLLGQVVARPLDDRLPAGRHSLTWNAEGLSSGLYFYRLTAGEYSDIRRMTIVK